MTNCKKYKINNLHTYWDSVYNFTNDLKLIFENSTNGTVSLKNYHSDLLNTILSYLS